MCLALIFGFAYMEWNIKAHQSHILPSSQENLIQELTGNVSKINKQNEKLVKFILHTVRGNFLLIWFNPTHVIELGDYLELSAKLNIPHGVVNTGGFDIEKYMFGERIIATGKITKNQIKILKKNNSYRNKVEKYIFSILGQSHFHGILIALVNGNNNYITDNQNLVLRRTGTAHLMAISGLHIGFVASGAFFISKLILRFIPVYYPTPIISAIIGLLSAVGYGLLAGMSVSTQRALIMVSITLITLMARRRISVVNSYWASMILILLFDPFQVLNVGFWLSYVAVGILLFTLQGFFKRNSKLKDTVKIQLIITICMLPISLLFFGQNTIIGPICNFIAIPLVSIIVVPFMLIGSVFEIGILLEISNFVVKILWKFLELCSILPILDLKINNHNLLICSLGIAISFLPKGIRNFKIAAIYIISSVIPNNQIIDYGTAMVSVADVGQGLATVIRTKNHALVYDTGPGANIVAPMLKTYNVKKIDKLIISHADKDHIGGAQSLIENIKVDNIITGEVERSAIKNADLCQEGDSWNYDGVLFTILHPAYDYQHKKSNNKSCVLLVEAADKSFLLTGDIEKKVEKELLNNYGNSLYADVMLIPHHGSRTSSSEEFIEAIYPKYALVSVGYQNSYGHPKSDIIDRYSQIGTKVYRTDLTGQINFTLSDKPIEISYYREQNKHFWNSGSYADNKKGW